MNLFHAGFTEGHPPVSVRFGPGVRRDLDPELDALGIGRAIILTTPQQAGQGRALVSALGKRSAGIFTDATMHTPVEVTEKALAELNRINADGIVSIGGGSTIGLGKALAWRTDLPQIVLPTTYAGSEATPVLGQTVRGEKSTFSNPKVQPEAIVYDPELVATLPAAMSVTSALNAMAHAVEALYAQDRNPLASALALQGIRTFHDALPEVVSAPDDLAVREATQFGAWLCGTVLGQVGMALHHKLCHVLGGTLNLPHAETHAIILPHAVSYNELATDVLQPVAAMFGAESAAMGLHDFCERMGAPLKLSDLGVKLSDLDRIAEMSVRNPYWNPRALSRDGIRRILQRAWEGATPELEV